MAIRDIQSDYFDLVRRFFGEPYAEMKRTGLDAPDIASDVANSSGLIRAFRNEAEEFAGTMREFWDHYAPLLDAEISTLNSLKSFFGGDIFPSYKSNIATSVGLYMDTILLPDPLLKICDMIETAQDLSQVLYLAVKHALNVLDYEELALANVAPPIVVIVPRALSQSGVHEALTVTSEGDLIDHASLLFGRAFRNSEEVYKFLHTIKTVEDFEQVVVRPERYLNDLETTRDIRAQLEIHLQTLKRLLGDDVQKMSVGQLISISMSGRMMQVNDLLLGSSKYGAAPLIDAPTSWQYLLWKYEYDGNASRTVDMKSAVMTHVIGSPDRKLKLLSHLPPRALIELRKENALPTLRESLSHGVREINFANNSSVPQIAKQVADNLNSVISIHERELDQLASRKQKLFKVDIPKCVVTGAISIASAATGNVALALASATAATLTGATVTDVWSEWRKIKIDSANLKHSPASILFKYM